MKNIRDSIFFTQLFVSERKQIAFMAEEKSPLRISPRLFATKTLRNEDKMKKILKKVMAITGALLMGATILAGIPGYTAKAAEVTRPNLVVQEGEILEAAYEVDFVKPGMSEKLYEVMHTLSADVEKQDADMKSCLLHGDAYEDRSYPNSDYTVPASEQGSNGWIITMLATVKPNTENPQYIYFLEPNIVPTESGSSDDAAPADTAPVYVYVEPAWLTTWKEMLVGIDKQIADAKEGDTVILDLGEYYNISNARMQQIAEKNDVTFILNITYDKVSYSLTIEPGTEIDLSCDWYGPLKLLSMFPYEVVE